MYDFVIYAYFAIYIGQTFFPSHDPTLSLLASLATFGAGFITRPLGAIVIGRLGDRVGRTPAMVLTFVLMGVAILGLALTPSYHSIGVAAPVIVIILRLTQGFALGGELGPSTSYLIEAAPPAKRGFYVSLQYLGQACAALLAGVMGVLLAHTLGEEALRDVGWRIAMLVGALVVPLGLVLRRNLPETLHKPEAESFAGEAPEPRAGRNLRLAVLAVVMLSAGTTIAHVLKYFTTYAIATLHMPARLAFTGTVIGGLTGICFSPLGGWLSDRFGRKPVMILELKKLRQHAPHAGLVLRIRVPNTGSMVELSSKFGAHPGEAVDLIAEAFSMGLVVEGISFHVGSQCTILRIMYRHCRSLHK